MQSETGKKDFLSINLAALEKNDPVLVQRIKSLAETNPTAVVSMTATGEPSLQVQTAAGPRRLHSRGDPRAEAQKWAARLSIPTGKTVALFGLGLGYPLEELIRQHRSQLQTLWCFESSLEVLREMLRWKDWRWLLEETRIIFFVEVEEGEVRTIAHKGFQQVVVDGLEVLEYPPCVMANPDWYAKRQDNIRDLIRQWSAEMLTVMERGRLFQLNMLKNFMSLGTSYLFREVGKYLTGKPAIMVSAGPSLNRNVHVLQRAKGRIPIVSVDTSLRILKKNGIEPDLVVSIDALGMSRKHFEGVSGLEQIPIVYDLEVTPEVLEMYPGPHYLLGNSKPFFYTWLEEKVGKLEGLTKGLTVAQATFQLLAHYGADPIILTGQDLSFEREGGKTHAEGAAFQGRFQPDGEGGGKWEDPLDPQGLREIQTLWVPANDGGKVPTTQTLFAYLKRFEDDLRQCSSKVINATEGGAFIQGTEVAGLAETLDRLMTSETENQFSQAIQSNRSGRIGEVYGAEIQALRHEMETLLAEAETVCRTGMETSEKLWRDLGWKNLGEKDVQRRFDPIFKAYSWICGTPRIQMLIDRGVMRSLYMLHKGDLPPVAERKNEHHRIVTERYSAFFKEALDMIQMGVKIINPGSRSDE